MLAARTRSGLVETVHDGAVAVVGVDGRLIASSGDIDRPFFLRSAAKPFQAAISQEQGANLVPVELALAVASHDGEPVHVAIVESMLSSVGLDVSDLACPESWPLSVEATGRLHAKGETRPRREWHNCSGKHAAWLRACQTHGWPIAGYLSPMHPLQKRIVGYVGELGGHLVTPLGVDVCGAPVLRTTTRVMALLYANLASLPGLREVFTVMHRYPALVSGTSNGDAAIAIAINAAAKRGAAGCAGVAVDNRFGIAVKSWDGSPAVVDSALVATLTALGAVPGHAIEDLAPYAHPVVLGGDTPVGELETLLELRWS